MYLLYFIREEVMIYPIRDHGKNKFKCCSVLQRTWWKTLEKSLLEITPDLYNRFKACIVPHLVTNVMVTEWLRLFNKHCRNWCTINMQYVCLSLLAKYIIVYHFCDLINSPASSTALWLISLFQARLHLFGGACTVLANGMAILGIKPVDKMWPKCF